MVLPACARLVAPRPPAQIRLPPPVGSDRLMDASSSSTFRRPATKRALIPEHLPGVVLLPTVLKPAAHRETLSQATIGPGALLHRSESHRLFVSASEVPLNARRRLASDTYRHCVYRLWDSPYKP